MNQPILEKLKEWRARTAQEERIPVYRVFNNQTLEAIALVRPKNKQELLAIKGIRDKKLSKYGQDILNLFKDGGNGLIAEERPVEQDKPYQVSNYLDLVNSNLRKQSAKVIGEISSLNIQSGYLFFGLKDKDDESLLSCFMWKRDYQLCGIEFEQGMEIIVQGFPEVYKPNGRFSLRVGVAELVGEGALKKAYLALKKKLEQEGLFRPERKKPIPDFVQKIGLLTSPTGAVIHDFLNNLGQYGYRIKFYPSRVEGQTAVKDLLAGIEYFQNQPIDILVIIRGGGSLESLQAFNNEFLARKIADFNKPVVCGIGHDQDIPLACLAADLMVSTPTAVSVVLNRPWEKALENIKLFEREIIYQFQNCLSRENKRVDNLSQKLKTYSLFIFKRVDYLETRLREKISRLSYGLQKIQDDLANYANSLLSLGGKSFEQAKDYLTKTEKRLRFFDPKRQLKLGYSIVSLKGRVVKKVAGIKKGDRLDIRLSDGKIKSRAQEIIK